MVEVEEEAEEDSVEQSWENIVDVGLIQVT